ncbi:MAG: chemotaxis protein, partial [Alphaproteobacteria bacterium]
AIARTRREIAAITSQADDSRLITATEELDAIVEATEKATSDILEAAEDVQETAWLLRENGGDEAICDRLDQRATDIYTACSFQDITGQRTSKVVQILHYLEKRLNSMIDIWGLDDIEVRQDDISDSRPDAHLLNGPQLAGRGLEQDAIDDMIGFRETEAEESAAQGRVITGKAEEIELAPPAAPTAPPADTATAAPPPAAEESGAAMAFDSDLVLDAPAAPEAVAEAHADQPSPEAGTASQQPPAALAETAAASEEAAAQASPESSIEAAAFQPPEDLTLEDLDEPKKAALFS